jgi:hypothetical protein
LSILKRFMHFCVLVDEEELDKVGSYDRRLIAASFARQMVGATFTFLVFFFASYSYLSLEPSILIASVLAAIVFFLDQAVIGSEWSISRTLNSAGALEGMKAWLHKLIVLLPRAAFAVAIALFMSTLAEITLQSRAIDRVLSERTRESNADARGRLDALDKSQIGEIDRAQKELDDLKKELEVASDQSLGLQKKNIESSLSSANQRLRDARLALQAVDAQIVGQNQEVGLAQAEVARLQKLLAQVTALQDREVNDPNRCRNPGSEGCKGDRWTEYNAKAISLEDQVVAASSKLEASRRQLDASLASQQDLSEQITALETTVGKSTVGLSQLSTTGRSVQDITSAIRLAEANLSALPASHLDQKSQLENQLALMGYMTLAVYDPLDRRIGLALLHKHPEYGPAAREFSWQLKLAVILFELAPVLITVFFSPFSFLSVHMRRKRDNALSEDKRAALQLKTSEAEAQAEKDTKAREIATKAALDKAANARRMEAEVARAEAGHFEELSKLMEQISQSKAAIVEIEQRSRNVEDRGEGDQEFDEIRRSMDLERLKHDLLRLKHLTDMLERQRSDKKSRNEGDHNDQDAV